MMYFRKVLNTKQLIILIMKKLFIFLTFISLNILSCEKEDDAPLILPSNPQQPPNG